MKPTVIGGGGEGELPPPPPVHTSTPTRITQPPSPTTISPKPKGTESMQVVTEVPLVTKPSGIPGVQRVRITTDRSLMLTKAAGRNHIVDAAIAIVDALDQSTLTATQALTWGQPLQEKYAALATTALIWSQSDTITYPIGHIQRLIDLMSSIELEKIFDKKSALSAVSGLFRKANSVIDTLEELGTALKEMAQLATLLQGCIQPLIKHRNALEEHSRAHDLLGDEIESSLLAAEAVAEYMKKISQGDIAARLEERVVSLTVTLGHIRSGSLMREVHIEQPTKLTTTIQDVVFNTLTSWMTYVGDKIGILRGNQTANPTDVREMSRTQQTILQKLRNI